MVTPTSGIVRLPRQRARLIIHGGRSLITYSLATAELELTTDEVPLPQVGQLFVPPAISNAICNCILVVRKKLVASGGGFLHATLHHFGRVQNSTAANGSEW